MSMKAPNILFIQVDQLPPSALSYDPSFSLALCCKDLRLLTELGDVSGTQLDMTKVAQEKFELARQSYGDDAPELLVAKLVEEASDVSLQVEGDWQKHWEV